MNPSERLFLVVYNIVGAKIYTYMFNIFPFYLNTLRIFNIGLQTHYEDHNSLITFIHAMFVIMYYLSRSPHNLVPKNNLKFHIVMAIKLLYVFMIVASDQKL